MLLRFSFIKTIHPLLIFFLLGMLVRIPWMPFIGFEQDYLFFTSWAEYGTDEGLLTIYDDSDVFDHGLINYPPVYLYMLWGLGKVYRLFTSASLESRTFLILLKTLTIFFEAILAYGIYRWLKEREGERAGLWGFALIFLNPAIFYVSVYYGQVDVIFAVFLLAAIGLTSLERYFWGGIFAATALMMKIQAIPFMPLLFLVPLARRKFVSFFPMFGGFVLGASILVAPFAFAGKLPLMLQRCLFESIEWGKFVSVGAFNLWYLHIEPSTYDERLWGWLFGSDGKLYAYPGIQLLTYKNVGLVLLGAAFFLNVYTIWRKPTFTHIYLAMANMALAFYMLPTKVHERYLFPFFVIYVMLAANYLVRRFFFITFSITYLINVMIICPFWAASRDVSEIDSSLGVMIAALNVFLYLVWMVYEFVPKEAGQRALLMAKTVGFSLALLLFIFLLRGISQYTPEPILYLSELTPISSQQDWPPVPPELTDDLAVGYGIGLDLSTDKNMLRIGDWYYRYGLGAHAQSRIEYEIPAGFDLFLCDVGVDYEVMPFYEEYPGWGTVAFRVWVNGEEKQSTPLMIPTSNARRIRVNLPKNGQPNRLTLIVDNYDQDSKADHADWALARVVRTENEN